MSEAAADLSRLSAGELQKLKAQAAAQLSDAQKRGRFALFRPLEHQVRWFQSRKQIVCIVGGNQMGKTTCGSIRLLAGALGTYPPSLGGTLPSSWDRLDCRGQRYLIVAESFSTVIAKTILPKLSEYLTQEMQAKPPKKNSGTKLPEVFYMRSGAEVHIQSYEQDSASFEGPTWDGVWFDEPPPQAVFNAVRRGTIARKGWIWITATPLREAWMRDVIVKPAEDDSDPMHEFADVFGGRMHDNCQECHGGYLPHAFIIGYLASLPAEERAVRERGEFFNVSDLAFGNVNEKLHVVPDLW